MNRKLYFAYGVGAHVLFLAVYAYLGVFVTDIGGDWLPKSVGALATSMGLWGALSVNLLLLAAFGVQHSVMARPAFKTWWTRFVPSPVERSTYVMMSNLVLILLFVAWQPMQGRAWEVQQPVLRTVLWVLCAAGWLMVPATTLMINHFDLFGTRQVWLHLKGEAYQPLPFRQPMLYKHMRHPLYVGWLIAFWATPSMSIGHLVFSTMMTTYILIAIPFEERDLLRHFGEKYAEYRERVPLMIPRILGNADKHME